MTVRNARCNDKEEEDYFHEQIELQFKEETVGMELPLLAAK